MIITTDQGSKRVIVTGERFQIALTWHQALALGSLLTYHSREVEPAARPGKTYSPSIERDRFERSCYWQEG